MHPGNVLCFGGEQIDGQPRCGRAKARGAARPYILDIYPNLQEQVFLGFRGRFFFVSLAKLVNKVKVLLRMIIFPVILSISVGSSCYGACLEDSSGANTLRMTIFSAD